MLSIEVDTPCPILLPVLMFIVDCYLVSEFEKIKQDIKYILFAISLADYVPDHNEDGLDLGRFVYKCFRDQSSVLTTDRRKDYIISQSRARGSCRWTLLLK